MNKDNTKITCNVLLIALLGQHLAGTWWDTPNKAFGMKTAQQQWDVNYDTVYRYLLRCIYEI